MKRIIYIVAILVVVYFVVTRVASQTGEVEGVSDDNGTMIIEQILKESLGSEEKEKIGDAENEAEDFIKGVSDFMEEHLNNENVEE